MASTLVLTIFYHITKAYLMEALCCIAETSHLATFHYIFMIGSFHIWFLFHHGIVILLFIAGVTLFIGHTNFVRFSLAFHFAIEFSDYFSLLICTFHWILFISL